MSTAKKTSARSKSPEKAAARRTKPAAPTAKPPAKKPAPPKASLAVGAKAPAFSLVADDGTTVSLESLRGRWTVLFFYPKDSTPGCTREAVAFEAARAALAKRGAAVVGVSRDSTKSHVSFKQKQGLGFPLLTDADASVHAAYGAYGEKIFYGKTIVGALRTTVIVDPDGKVAKVFAGVKVDGHDREVLDALDALGAKRG